MYIDTGPLQLTLELLEAELRNFFSLSFSHHFSKMVNSYNCNHKRWQITACRSLFDVGIWKWIKVERWKKNWNCKQFPTKSQRRRSQFPLLKENNKDSFRYLSLSEIFLSLWPWINLCNIHELFNLIGLFWRQLPNDFLQFSSMHQKIP